MTTFLKGRRNFFLGGGKSFSNMGGWGADSQNFDDIYQPLFFSTSSQWVGGAVKTQNQIQILGEIYQMQK